ncbi:MAG: hypothetical protein WCK49_02225 [Myxococcaceae bacterium]
MRTIFSTPTILVTVKLAWLFLSGILFYATISTATFQAKTEILGTEFRLTVSFKKEQDYIEFANTLNSLFGEIGAVPSVDKLIFKKNFISIQLPTFYYEVVMKTLFISKI